MNLPLRRLPILLSGILWLLAACSGTIETSPPTDPCANVFCSGHGRCLNNNGLPLCACESGFAAEGLDCTSKPGPCNGVDCGPQGICQVNDGAASCLCNQGYHAAGLICVANSGPCDGVDCGAFGSCYDAGGAPACSCQIGFHAEGLTCVGDSGPCDGIDCGGHGSCYEADGAPACQCHSGFHAEGLSCVADGGTCTGVDCGGHGSCYEAGGLPACQCHSGYHAEGLVCVRDVDPCAGIDCSGHGTCETRFGNPACLCDSGYHASGLACIRDDPCEGITCGNHAHCEVGLCVCDEGYQGNPDLGCSVYNSEEERVRAELVAIAEAEIGNCEGEIERPYMLESPGMWCYDFVDWVYQEADEGLPHLWDLPRQYTADAPDGWRPKPGDLIKYYFQHYCMVSGVSEDGRTIYTIEGNYGSCVVRSETTMNEVFYFGVLEDFFANGS